MIENNKFIFILEFILFFISFMAGIIYSSITEVKKSYVNGYKDACIDMYKGELKYKLVENKDGTRTWQKINSKEISNVKK